MRGVGAGLSDRPAHPHDLGEAGHVVGVPLAYRTAEAFRLRLFRMQIRRACELFQE
jgi:hypothetical protein